MSRYIRICAVLVICLAVVGQAQAIVVPPAPLPVNAYLVSSNYGGLLGPGYNTYTDAGAGMTFVQGMTSNFASANVLGLNGTLESQAWRDNGTGYLTFIYQLENTGTRMIRSGNIYGYDPNLWNVTDAGVLHFGGPDDYVAGDVLAMSRSNAGGNSQVSFSFQALNNVFSMVEELLAPGQKSNWFYYSTDAPGLMVGYAGVIDSGATADHIKALIPIPEPTTMMAVFAGIASIGGYLRRRLG